MMARLMRDSVASWARHYRIDSFRFDLMGHQPRAAMEHLQQAVDAAAGRHVPLIGEGWNFGEIADGARFVQASQRALGGSGIATFSDRAVSYTHLDVYKRQTNCCWCARMMPAECSTPPRCRRPARSTILSLIHI